MLGHVIAPVRAHGQLPDGNAKIYFQVTVKLLLKHGHKPIDDFRVPDIVRHIKYVSLHLRKADNLAHGFQGTVKKGIGIYEVMAGSYQSDFKQLTAVNHIVDVAPLAMLKQVSDVIFKVMGDETGRGYDVVYIINSLIGGRGIKGAVIAVKGE
jgi:hypothetical protein